MKILFTGGDGQLAKEFKKQKGSIDIYFASKSECDISDEKSIINFTKEHGYFDIIIAGAIIYPGDLDRVNLNSLLTGINHIFLVNNLIKPPKYFIHFTTSVKLIDEHFLYRSQKVYTEDLLERYFKYENKGVKFLNIMPNHVSDESIKVQSTTLIMELLTNIEKYTGTNYVVDTVRNTIRPDKW